MANIKISALPASTVPLAGTEVLPIVQSGSTVKVSVADLTAGRAVASAGGSFTDNLIQGTAAKGINFTANTPAAGMTSQLLNWYEEGTWTPDFSAWTIAPAVVYEKKYTKVGNLVTVQLTLSGGVCGAGQAIGGLPFAVVASGIATMRDISGGTSYSIAVARSGTSQIQSALAVSFAGQNWVLTASYFT